MTKKDRDSKPDPGKPPKQRRALRRRGLWERPGELYQQAPEPKPGQQAPEPKPGEHDRSEQKRRKGQD
jgi:hypothetical protein